MKIEFRKIPESEFIRINAPVVFGDKSTNRVFGILSNDIMHYKFAWQSDKIDPAITFIGNEICLIGIDQDFVILNFNTGNIFLKLLLTYIFYGVKVHNDYLYVITELEIIKISIPKFEILETFALPDYFEGIKFYDDVIQVKCAGNEIINIK